LVASDPDGDDISFIICSAPPNGTLLNTDNSNIDVGGTVKDTLRLSSTTVRALIQYIPSLGFNGLVGFTFRVDDGTGVFNHRVVFLYSSM